MNRIKQHQTPEQQDQEHETMWKLWEELDRLLKTKPVEIICPTPAILTKGKYEPELSTAPV